MTRQSSTEGLRLVVGVDAHRGDLALVAAVVDRAPGAYEAFIERTGRLTRACLADVLAHAPWAQADEADLLQAFELMLVDNDFRALRTYSAQAALTTWLHVVATRFFRRRAAALRPDPRSLVAIEGAVPEVESPESLMLRGERVAAVRVITAALPEEDRLLLALLYEQELDASTIAPVLGVTPSGVRMRKSRLLADLARRLRSLRR